MQLSFLRAALFASISCLTFASFAQTKPKTKTKVALTVSKVPVKPFNSSIDSVSYAVGVLVAQNFKSQKVTLNPEMVAKGFASVTSGGTL
jgi:FKBP-type peptidyl-prolyl cis-trans isomerase FklB